MVCAIVRTLRLELSLSRNPCSPMFIRGVKVEDSANPRFRVGEPRGKGRGTGPHTYAMGRAYERVHSRQAPKRPIPLRRRMGMALPRRGPDCAARDHCSNDPMSVLLSDRCRVVGPRADLSASRGPPVRIGTAHGWDRHSSDHQGPHGALHFGRDLPGCRTGFLLSNLCLRISAPALSLPPCWF